MTRSKFVTARTVGQKLLIETRASLGELAKCADVSRTTVAKWRDGTTTPKEGARSALAARYSIPFETWEEQFPDGVEVEVIPRKAGRPKASADEDTEATTATERVAKRVAVVRDSPYPEAPGPDATIVDSMKYSLACIRYDLRVRDLTTAARSKLRGDEARTLSHIAKLQRDEELRETHYVKNHPAFRAHCVRILEALRPYPDASKAVARALKEG